MRLAQLAQLAGISLASPAEVQVSGFAIDNRKVAPGTVFGAFQGAAVNGEDFIPAAVAANGRLRAHDKRVANGDITRWVGCDGQHRAGI